MLEGCGVKVESEPYKHEPHTFVHRAGGKMFCHVCGLIALNNAFSDWAVKMGCMHKDHPSYQSKRYQFTKLGG